MSLFATRPIMRDEEITVEYTKLANSRQTRRGRLFEMYHFHCECETCNLPSDKVAASDAARLELERGSETGYCDPLEWCKNLSLPDAYLVDKHKRCIALYEQEGIIDYDYVLHVAELATVYGMLADQKNFELWALKAQKGLEMMGMPSGIAVADPKKNFRAWGWRLAEKARG
jgi:hypothetical protein